MTYQCKVCGKEFWWPPFRMIGGADEMCSLKCRDKMAQAQRDWWNGSPMRSLDDVIAELNEEAAQ